MPRFKTIIRQSASTSSSILTTTTGVEFTHQDLRPSHDKPVFPPPLQARNLIMYTSRVHKNHICVQLTWTTWPATRKRDLFFVLFLCAMCGTFTFFAARQSLLRARTPGVWLHSATLSTIVDMPRVCHRQTCDAGSGRSETNP